MRKTSPVNVMGAYTLPSVLPDGGSRLCTVNLLNYSFRIRYVFRDLRIHRINVNILIMSNNKI